MPSLCGSVVLLLSMLAITSYAEEISSFCPPGFVRNETGSCLCWKHHLHGILQCNDNTGVAKIADGYCMTFDYQMKSIVIGKCPFRNHSSFELDREVLYTTLPDSVYDLESKLCGGYHREGILCSKCEEFYGPSVTFSMDCVPCRNVFGHFGRFVYVLIQFVQATLVYLLIIVFNIRLTKSPMNCFLLFAQVVVNMVKYDTALYSRLVYATSKSSFFNYSMKLVLSFYGYWNLDFFPIILPDFCIATSLKGIHLIFLQYIVALFPLILTAIIYFLVNLYTRHVKVVVLLWRVIRYCLSPKLCCGFRWMLNRISMQGLANSFASFLLIAYSKIIFDSVSFFLPTHLYTVNTTYTSPVTVMYYDPRVEFFGPKHWSYSILVFIILLLFTVLPLLLLFLYPFCSSRCTKFSSHSIRFFVESFQGWFKDGTKKGTKDFRLISCLNPLVRIVFGLMIMLVTMFVDPSSDYYFSRWLLVGLMFVATSMFFALARPYKFEYMNSFEALLYSLLGIISFLASYTLGFYVIFLLCPIPMIVLLGYGMCLFLKRVRTLFRICRDKKLNHYPSSERRRLMRSGYTECPLPHRLEKPGLYKSTPTPRNMDNYPPPLERNIGSYGAIADSN